MLRAANILAAPPTCTVAFQTICSWVHLNMSGIQWHAENQPLSLFPGDNNVCQWAWAAEWWAVVKRSPLTCPKQIRKCDLLEKLEQGANVAISSSVLGGWLWEGLFSCQSYVMCFPFVFSFLGLITLHLDFSQTCGKCDQNGEKHFLCHRDWDETRNHNTYFW